MSGVLLVIVVDGSVILVVPGMLYQFSEPRLFSSSAR
jgi:hypothetical protein